jgi:DNA-binding transcriptional LysR family regulator
VHARKAVEAVAAARDAVEEPARAQSVVRLGILPTVAPTLVPEALAAFHAACPDVGLMIVTRTNAELLSLLRGAELDVAVGRMSDPAATAGLTFELLYLDGLALGMRGGHPLLADRPFALARTLAFPLVVCNAGSAPHRNTEALFGTHGLRLPGHAIETLDVATASRIVRGSDAIWIAPTSAVRAADGLVIIDTDAPAHTGTEAVGIFRRLSEPALAETEALIASLRSSVAGLGGSTGGS